MTEYYIASVSWGKDSLAMLLFLIEHRYPLNEVVFFNNGMDFQAIYNIRDQVVPLLTMHGIKYTELKPERPFLYDMLERPKTKRTGERVCGDGWCGGACRWGTFAKQKALNGYCGKNHTYIGLAFDEQSRLSQLEKHKTSPIAEAKMTEADCLKYCYDRGFFWEENGVRLYDILDRVSCWCCANKNLKELRNIYLYMPEYWQKLKDLQSQIDRPLKRYSNKRYGNYGNVFDLEKVFEKDGTV